MLEKAHLAKLAEYLIRLGDGGALKNICDEIMFLEDRNWDVEAALKEISSAFTILPKSDFNKASFCRAIDKQYAESYEHLYDILFSNNEEQQVLEPCTLNL